MTDKTSDFQEQRKYIRFKSVFPVKFSLLKKQCETSNIVWFQGYTCNVGRGGFCLETVYVDSSLAELIAKQKIFLDVYNSVPLARFQSRAICEVVWVRKDKEIGSDKFTIGLKYIKILSKDLNQLVSHVRWNRVSSRSAIICSLCLFTAFTVSFVFNYRLRSNNKKLINHFVDAQNEESSTVELLKKLSIKKVQLAENIKKLEDVFSRNELESEYQGLLDRENRTSDKLSIIERKRKGLQKTVVNKMYLWLKNHKNNSTGQVLSFEGDVGIIKDWAFTYDQALAACVFLLFDDVESAKDVLSFYKRILSDDFKGFANGYYYDSGVVAEDVVHCGPNLWIGIAIAQYAHMTGDDRYNQMAERIADWLITVQDADPAGGLKGGPKYSWFATEHNLDGYAFFDMVYEMTGKDKYKTAREKVLSWLKQYAMRPHSMGYDQPPVNRGKGDATIATDTFAWSIAALGPTKLTEIGMDPEAIMKFAQDNSNVKVKYERPSGVVVEVEGFDFSRHANLARGGLVSPEWTSQMIVSFKILSDYFADKDDYVKAGFYGEKSQYYLKELNKLIISSPSPLGQGAGCLPYATSENVETGHGWNTPYGASTCSVAGTAYAIMSIKDFNPLMLKQSHEGGF